MKALALALALIGCLAWPESPAAAAAVSDWVEVEGSAEVAGGTTLEQARVVALNQARSKAIADVTGTRITDEVFMGRSGEGALNLFRETRALQSGRVVAEEVVGWTNDSIQRRADDPPVPLLRVKLRARVAKDDPADPTFKVSLALPKRRFAAGEPVTLRLQASQDAHALVFSLGADDRVRLVFPNQYRPAVRLERDRPLELPGPQDPFEIRPEPLPGHAADVEAVKVVATRTRVEPPRVDVKSGTVQMVDFFRWLSAIPPRERAEWTEEYTVFAPDDRRP